jgi:hypothetical protein
MRVRATRLLAAVTAHEATALWEATVRKVDR